MRLLLILLVSALTLPIFVAVASAHSREGSNPPPMMDDMAMPDDDDDSSGKGPLAQLNLTDEQKKKVGEIREKSRADLQAKREAVRTAGEAFKKAMTPENTSADIMSKFTDFQTKRNEFGKAHMEKRMAIREVLTPEQRKKMHELHEGHHGKGPKHGMDRGGKRGNKHDK